MDKTIIITLINKNKNKFYNTLYLLKDGKILHTQSKHQLFKLNFENRYFHQGDENDIKTIDVDGLKIGFVICFELRFIKYWEKLQGCDIIFIPAMWGIKRKDSFIALTKALAIMNQCFVVCSDSKDSSFTSSSGIINPFGVEYRDENATVISQDIDLREIKKMRKYLPVGIK